jgi:hypothetical protein
MELNYSIVESSIARLTGLWDRAKSAATEAYSDLSDRQAVQAYCLEVVEDATTLVAKVTPLVSMVVEAIETVTVFVAHVADKVSKPFDSGEDTPKALLVRGVALIAAGAGLLVAAVFTTEIVGALLALAAVVAYLFAIARCLFYGVVYARCGVVGIQKGAGNE